MVQAFDCQSLKNLLGSNGLIFLYVVINKTNDTEPVFNTGSLCKFNNSVKYGYKSSMSAVT